jgi:hypothetical protein
MEKVVPWLALVNLAFLHSLTDKGADSLSKQCHLCQTAALLLAESWYMHNKGCLYTRYQWKVWVLSLYSGLFWAEAMQYKHWRHGKIRVILVKGTGHKEAVCRLLLIRLHILLLDSFLVVGTSTCWVWWVLANPVPRGWYWGALKQCPKYSHFNM